RQFDRINSGEAWRLFEPNTMLHATEIQDGVPTIRTLSKLTLAQSVEIQTDLGMESDRQRGADRYNRRCGLGSPEDSLLEKGSFGIGREKPTPNADGIRRLCFDPTKRLFGNLARTTRCGAGIPTPFRSFPLVRSGRSRCRLTISS